MKNQIKYIAIFLCLAGLTVSVEYTDWQKAAMEGLRMGFDMGQAYQKAIEGTDIAGFNAKVDNYNAWVRTNFGEDTTLLMQKMIAPTDLSKPVLIANNTTSGGIVHAIDGGVDAGAKYTTNDINLLPDSAIKEYQNSPDYMGDAYLGGV